MKLTVNVARNTCIILLSIQRNIIFIYENQKLYYGTLLATQSFASLS